MSTDDPFARVVLPTSADPLVSAMWFELERQAQLSDQNPPPAGYAPYPTGWHDNPTGAGTAINLVTLAAAVRKALKVEAA